MKFGNSYCFLIGKRRNKAEDRMERMDSLLQIK